MRKITALFTLAIFFTTASQARIIEVEIPEDEYSVCRSVIKKWETKPNISASIFGTDEFGEKKIYLKTTLYGTNGEYNDYNTVMHDIQKEVFSIRKSLIKEGVCKNFSLSD